MDISENWYTTGSWTAKLYDILRPAPPDSIIRTPTNNRSRSRHSPGDFWKHTFSTSIYNDLDGIALQHDSSGALIYRRFVRVEHIGLSGVVFYQILIPPSEPILNDTTRYLTLQSVFGDLNNPSDEGMDLEDLLDAVNAKMVYFPTYACTSFMIGHVMSAYLQDQPQYRPWPAYQGFSVCMGESNTATLTPLLPCHADIVGNVDVDVGEDVEDSALNSTLSQLRSFGKSLMEILSLEAQNPYTSLCIRSSSLDTTSDSSGTREELESVTSSTVESSGPPTPPSSVKLSDPPSSMKLSERRISSYDDLLSFLDLSLEGYEP